MRTLKLIMGLIASVTIITACSKGDPPPTPDPKPPYVEYWTNARFSLQDPEGNDLLNSATPGSINVHIGAIRASYLDEKEEIIPVYDVDFNIRNYGCRVVKWASSWTGLSEYFVLNMDMESCYKIHSADGALATSVNYLHWPENITDKLECEYIMIESGPPLQRIDCFLNKILINEELHWERPTESSLEYQLPYFKIVIDGDQRTITSIVP